MSEADKPIIDEFLKFSHSKNRAPDDVKDIVDWFYKAQEQQKQAMYDADRSFHDQAVGDLRAELGQDYNRYVNGLKSFISAQAGDKMFGNMMGARLADGTLAGDNPEFLKLWINMMNEINPAASLVNATSTNPMTDINAEIAKIEKMMREDRPAYDRDPNNAKRALELYEARDKLNQRAA